MRLTDSSVLQPTCGSFRRKVVVRKYQVTVEMLGARPQMCRRTPCRTFGLACWCGTAWRVDAPLLPVMTVRPASDASGPRATLAKLTVREACQKQVLVRVTPEAKVARAAPEPRVRRWRLAPKRRYNRFYRRLRAFQALRWGHLIPRGRLALTS